MMDKSCVALLLLCLAAAPLADAQSYPRRPITLIVPNAPGGAFDAAARPLAQAMSQALGQPLVIDNRPAGQGIIGTQAAARHVLQLSAAPLTQSQRLVVPRRIDVAGKPRALQHANPQLAAPRLCEMARKAFRAEAEPEPARGAQRERVGA